MNEIDCYMTALAHVNEAYVEEYKVFLEENKLVSSEESAIYFLNEKEKELLKVESK